MPKKRFSAEQIVAVLRQIEVRMQGKAAGLHGNRWSAAQSDLILNATRL